MIYETIIIGSGPAGLTASIYASRYKIRHLVLGGQLGGTMALIPQIENYPGFKSISGMELTQRMVEQAKELGGEIKVEEVVKISKKQDFFEIQTEKETYQTKTIILATGTQRRQLGVPGEKQYLGKGVSYCSTCDAAFFKDKTVAVVGGANAAVMAAVHLAGFAQKVYLIYRRKPLRAEPIWRERAENNPKIEIIYETNILRIFGKEKAEKEIRNPKLEIRNKSQIPNSPAERDPASRDKFQTEGVGGVKLDKEYKGGKILPVDGVFIEIGGVPTTELIRPLGVEIDDKGFVKVNVEMATNIPGIFAAGDITDAAGEFQQIVIAIAQGARAVLSVFKYLNG